MTAQLTGAPAPARRTQAERRNETIGKLVDATIETISEIGYHRASLGEICARSGISRGGLFRHFESRLDLVVAAAEEVARRHLNAFDTLRESVGELSVADLLAFTRGEARAETNSVWFELLVAARTEPDLREQLAPVASALYSGIEERALVALESSALPATAVQLLATSIIHMFDGEAILRHTYPRPDLEQARLEGAASLIGALAADGTVRG